MIRSACPSSLGILLLVAASLWLTPASALDFGTQAPEISPQELISGGEGDFDPGVLEGKAVVLEFWATWCGPCVDAIPHWNELAEEFTDENVVFLSITDEGRRTARRFLKKHPMAGLVAVDTDRSTFDAYGVRGIPRTFLIDAQGRLQRQTHPALLQAEHIRGLLAGNAPQVEDLASEGMTIEELAGAFESAPVFRAIIRPASQTDRRMMTGGHGRFWALNASVATALRHAYEVSPARLLLDAELPEEPYDFLFDVGEETDATPFLRAAVEHTFDLTSVPESRELDVLVLRALPGAEDKLPPGVSGGRTTVRSDAIQGSNLSLSALASLLENLMRQPVLNETELAGRYEIDLAWERGSFDSLDQALREDFGLELAQERRTIEATVIQSAP